MGDRCRRLVNDLGAIQVVLENSEGSRYERCINFRVEERIAAPSLAPPPNSRGATWMYEKRDERAGEVRSAVADDRRRGAGSGKRSGLVARGLISTVTVVPRDCAPPRRSSSRHAGDLCDVEGIFSVLYSFYAI